MKHYLSYIINIVLLLSGVNGAAGQDNSTTPTYWENMASGVSKIENKDGGDGSAWDNAILIATAQELAYFAQQVNKRGAIAFGENGSIEHNGAGGNNFKGYYFALSADIDLSGHYWTPIGSASPSFKGHFDGAGHEVKGLVVNMEGQYGSVYAGLFGYLYDGAAIRNLGVRLGEEGVKVTLAYVDQNIGSYAYAGGLAGYLSNGSISNCYVEGEACVMASGPNDVCAGGLVGFTFGSATITHCYTTVNVSTEGLQRKECGAGGIVGLLNNSGNISYTYATGIVGTTASQMAGGICGRLYAGGGITNSLALNTEINGEDTGRIGGYSSNKGTFSDNYASPEIQVNDQPVSGGAANDKNGNSGVNLDNFGSIFTWGDGWNTGDGTHLPQLKMQTEDTDGNITYSPWPTGGGYTSQPSLDATRYLIATGFEGDDDGSSDHPYKIANRAQLAYLAKQVNDKKENDGKTDDGKANGYEGKYFILTADIDLSPFFWTPIGTVDNPFKGNFDGKGHCVKGLKVYVEGDGIYTVCAGLFGCTNTGTLCNLGVWLAEEGVHIVYSGSADAYAGGIAGTAKYIFNCYVTGEGEVAATSISGAEFKVGGIAGYIIGALSDCYATVDVKVKAENKYSNCAGGIAGNVSIKSTFSRTYATGAVEAAGGNGNYAGGICGRIDNGTLSYNLALNSEITGDEGKSGRIIGSLKNASSSANYASTKTKCNSKDNLYGSDGTPTCLETFLDDLKDQGNGWGDSWDIGDGTNLPKLRMKVKGQDGSSYEPWLDGQQPSLLASNYLSTLPKLHIVSPTGGTLTVSDQDGKEVPNDTKIRPGTSLTLAYAENTNYRFSRYLSGSSADNLQALSGNTIEMPDADLWLNADFNYQDPTPPPPPPTVYYTVSLPSVEGAVTDPLAGSYEVESWSTFCFYLMPEPDYSESEPVVTTSRGETIMPRTSDGAYLVKYVRTDVEIFIDGIVKNLPPVANDPIRAVAPEPEIWNEDACLCIRLPEGMPTSPVRIFTPEGRLLDSFRSVPGLNRRQLPTGIYIVQVGDTVRKVLIK